MITQQEKFTGTIEFLNVCAQCKGCCTSIDEGVCGYHILKALLEGRIPSNLVKKFVIFRIHKKYLDVLAEDWVLRPSINILPLITKEVKDHYEFLMLPKFEKGCPFLTPKGCKYPELKLYDCRVFPFYYEKGNFHIFEQCAYAKQLDIEEMKKSLKNMTDEFIEYSRVHQEAYFTDLKRLKESYQLQTYDIPQSKTPLCSDSALKSCYKIDAEEMKKK